MVSLKIAGIDNVALAKKAIPLCNIKYLDGAEMKTAVGGYLEVLYNANPKSIGGEKPTDNLYYTVK